MKPFVAIVSLDSAFLERSCLMLEADGYSVITFNNPTQALEAFVGVRFDVLLTTIMLGGLNGYAFSQQASHLLPGLRTILASTRETERGSFNDSFPEIFLHGFSAADFAQALTRSTLERKEAVVEQIDRYIKERVLR